MNRREAIKLAGMGIAAVGARPRMLFGEAKQSNRPAAGQRKFTSEAVEAKIAEVNRFLGPDTELAWMFENWRKA